MQSDYELKAHRDWINLLRPIGLIVSAPALANAQAFPDKNIIKQQQAYLGLGESWPGLAKFAEAVLGWKPGKLVSDIPDELCLPLPEFHETLRPTYAVRAPKEDGTDWLMLVVELGQGTPLDEPVTTDERHWNASPEVRLERLLREKNIPIGLLCNGQFLRLIYAPSAETSGHISWPLSELSLVRGRDMLSALCMLLGSARLFALPTPQRLPHILRESRKYQNVVSTKLAGQVLEALNELLRGFQAANEAAHGKLLDETVREDPNHIYGGLLAVLLRLVFILYAEERGLLSSATVYVRSYSLVSLFEKLRADAGRFPDTMDQRYGAWARLLVLFRMVHDGAQRGDLRIPPRRPEPPHLPLDPARSSERRPLPPAHRRTPPVRLPLHAPRANPTHRSHDAQANPRILRQEPNPSRHPGPQDL